MSSTPDVIRNRFLGFLIWQSILSTAVFVLWKALLAPFTLNPLLPSLFGCLAFIFFCLSMSLFAISIHAVASPQHHRPASILELALGLMRLVFAASSRPQDGNFRRRARVSIGIVLLVSAAALSGLLAIISIVGGSYRGSLHELIGGMGSRGFAIGVLYGIYHVFKQRWVLVFPIIQRPAFFSFKMDVPSAIKRALKFSIAAYMFSALLMICLPRQHKNLVAGWSYFANQFTFYTGSFVVILCWELIQHLHKVLHTKRFMFAPPKGSAAAETNPSEPLLAALEESPPRSLLQYLAYLDLSMVCGTNIDIWRRAAVFEETGDTYKRVIAACTRPLEQLASKLGEGLPSSIDSIYQLSNQLLSPYEIHQNSEILESFNDFQLYAWCAQAAASLTAHSHQEDRFGVAQLSGGHASVLSTLLSCLLAVETFMGKKTNLQSSLGPAGIKWATNSSARREIAMAMNKRKDSPLHLKAYSLADVLKISIYCIVSEFHDEMTSSAKLGLLEKDWLSSGKPVFGSRELLLLKLQLFLTFRAS
ncbi:hypothetical protein Nepgr_005773 [Nepenthes gracilis]|uniref:Nucleoporin protein Ndc1-Nup n=1 Tax=Nepenthes gracilis TaxID=150966 RepID=A0AAD3S3U2_NEPGR|nr:hypothetical protein Nepgr_005773 [Nepenthes gracilis]